MLLVHFYKSFYLTRRAYLIAGGVILLMAVAYFFPFIAFAARLAGLVLVGCVILDIFLLYGGSGHVEATREAPTRFSNGDPNTVTLHVRNVFPFPLRATVIDELPLQFQERSWKRYLALKAGETTALPYTLTPKQRGVYNFGQLHLFVASPLSLVRRR